MWEHPANRTGGKWIVQVKNSQRESLLNQFWLFSVLGCIGASFDDDDEICGLVISLRKSADKICLWTRTANDAEKCKRIGRQFRDMLGVSSRLQYQLHHDAMQQDSSFTNKSKYDLS
eukprot:TRINITY_DN1231_c0_g1_i1.p1 TRINITY_DN1231_c0_g1~~TRINITY_DN1231_c0_g1_i1.p1  ORF type:complete len:117 (-),score=12.14 TRINITY_DN1231_c0_g1_i1:90-440(-)